ncbi:MAG: hypothetical protein M1838_005413 [Thelocarpon superellum]|nr:MAG: hypothetical protein M1838_005413 [Thelocarpon superellum]
MEVRNEAHDMRDTPPSNGRGRATASSARGARRGRADHVNPPPAAVPRGETRGSRRGGRTRGGSSRGNAASGPWSDRPAADARHGPRGPEAGVNGSVGGTIATQKVTPMAPAGDVEAEVCFICASPVVHNAVSPCNHRTCHICALRLRALYKNKACAHCRTNADYVIFTDDAVKRYEEYADTKYPRQDDNLGIKYEQADIFEDTVLLLRYNCPDPSCDVACLGWPDLHRHVRSVHQKAMCDLCTRNKKVFTHEHELFTPNELRKHEKFGDDNPGAVDQSGFRGHPECGFCRLRFYGDDELYEHCRDRHERCHICDRRMQVRQQEYYVDYNALEVHFQHDHFLCLDRECLEKKFVVFDSQLDLKAHQLDAHPNDLSKDARREARRVDLSGLEYRGPQDERGGRREGRGRGRGRDPNTEPIPTSTAQPLRRDELAYQRQMAVQSAQSVSTRTFGGQLTTSDTVTARRPARPAETAAPFLHPLSLDPARSHPPSPRPETAVTPQEQARRLRHGAVMERAATMLRNDDNKMKTFRSKVSFYQQSSMTAAELIDAFFTLFDTSAAELGKLIKSLADIYEAESKRTDLLKAWNDWRAINEDYPALPGPSGVGLLEGAGLSSGSVTGGNGGGSRVLKLKSSTAQSSRSPVSRHGSWGSASASSEPASNPFPPISSTTIRPGSGPRPLGTGAGKGSASASSFPVSSSLRPATQNSITKATPADTTTEAFPALPAAAKPQSTIFGYGSGAVRRDYGASSRGGAASVTVGSAWGNNATTSATATSGSNGANGKDERGTGVGGGGGNTGGKKKAGGGNKGKKNTLIQWG